MYPHPARLLHASNLRLSILSVTISVLFAFSATAATIRFDDTNATGVWETPQNWVGDVVPGASDVADIGSTFTASVSSANTIQELHVGHPNSSATYVPGTSTLNVLPGTSIAATASGGVRVGRLLRTGQLPGTSKGIVVQTGGLVQVNSGTNGVRLSEETGAVASADSLYRISGGSMRGGPTNGSMTAPLQIGNIAGTYTSTEFHMMGSGIAEARFEDVRIQGNASGTTTLHFSLDAGGVTPLIAEDEMRFVGTNTNTLLVDLIGAAALTDITLITADRLNTASSAPSETFTGLADGAPISASFGPYTYNWLVRYQDASDNGVLDAFVKLQFVSRTEIPEPASLTLLGLIGAAFGIRRRHR